MQVRNHVHTPLVKRCKRSKFCATRYSHISSAGFTYRLYRPKPKASRSKGASNKLVCIVNGRIWSFRLNFVKSLCLNYYSRNLVLFNFRGDNARVFQRVSMNLNMTVGQAACQLLCRYTQEHTDCILRLLNRTDCDVWLCPKNLWLFIYEMHLITGITDGWLGCEVPPLTKLNVNAGPLSSLYFGIYCSFDFSRLLFFAFSECFPVISGFVYPFKKLPDLLLFLKYFLSVSQWAIQLRVPLTLQLSVPCLKPLVTSLHLIKERLYCKLELCTMASSSILLYNKNIVVSQVTQQYRSFVSVCIA